MDNVRVDERLLLRVVLRSPNIESHAARAPFQSSTKTLWQTWTEIRGRTAGSGSDIVSFEGKTSRITPEHISGVILCGETEGKKLVRAVNEARYSGGIEARKSTDE